MKKVMYWALVLPLTASVILSGCKKDDEDIVPTPPPVTTPVDGLTFVGSGTLDEAEIDIRLYADQELFVGYNKIYTILLEKGTMNQVKSAEVTYMPMMDMATMSHTCPTENPISTDPTGGLFEGAAVFIMPTGDMGTWRFGVTVKDLSNNLLGQVDIDISVKMPADVRVFSFESPIDMKKIFITLAEPSKPITGMNDLIVLAHYKAGMTSFPAVEDLIIEFEPLMPSMGHGSPDNVNPVHMTIGHYQGEVNLSMPGWWQLNMTIKDNTGAILDDDHVFDVNF
jgi:hypothetical protein